MSKQPEPIPGLYRRKGPGQTTIVRVMGVLEGWVVYRQKRHNPQLETVNNFWARFESVEGES